MARWSRRPFGLSGIRPFASHSYIAPFAKTNDQVPGFLKNDLKSIEQGILEGSIPTTP